MILRLRRPPAVRVRGMTKIWRLPGSAAGLEAPLRCSWQCSHTQGCRYLREAAVEQAGSRLGDDSKSRATVELAWSSFLKEGTPGSARDGCTPRSVIVLKIIGGRMVVQYAWDKRRQLCHCVIVHLLSCAGIMSCLHLPSSGVSDVPVPDSPC